MLLTEYMIGEMYSNLCYEYTEYFVNMTLLYYSVSDVSDLNEDQINELILYSDEITDMYPFFGQCVRDVVHIWEGYHDR